MIIDDFSKGVITFTSYSNINKLNLSDYCVKLQIVRYISKGHRIEFIHVPHLAPSAELFNRAMYKWKRLIFSSSERRFLDEGKTGTWFDLYEDSFIKEKKHDPEFLKAYARIKELSLQGKSILICCYCDNPDRCHRKIIADMLLEDNFPVVFG